MSAVAGERYLAVTDALYDNAERIRLYSCRQEGVAAFMAEAGQPRSTRPVIHPYETIRNSR
ncbi:MAG: thiamine pyrophosphate-binding protein [Mycetocola sp.]